MTKLILAPVLALTPTFAVALALSAATAAPAHANPSAAEPVLTASGGPFASLVALLLPAVQKVR